MMFVQKETTCCVLGVLLNFPLFNFTHLLQMGSFGKGYCKPETKVKLPEEHLRNSELGRLCQDSQNWEQHSTKYFLQVKKSLLMINPRFYTKH